MDEQSEGFRDRLISIQTAAERLGVSVKTIQRYLAKGHLTKVKLGSRTYLDPIELDPKRLPLLRKTVLQNRDTDSHSKDMRTSSWDVVTLTRARYETLFIELGELRKQNEILLAERSQSESRLADMAQRERELDLALARLKSDETRTSVMESELATARERIRELEEQLSRFQAQKQWWQR